MAGTKAGGVQAAATNRRKYGDDFYARIGATGGRKSKTGGFYANRKLAREAGRIGGLKSKRGTRNNNTNSKLDSSSSLDTTKKG